MNFKNKPLVSIVIPTYNHAKFIGKAIESVLEQTYVNWEAIVIDNQSIDDTQKIINQFKDSRIKYFKISNFGIIAKSRNFGIEVAKGKWIAFLDSDDWWTKNKIEICINNANDNVDFIYHDLEVVYKRNKFIFNKKKTIGRHLKKPILKDLLISEIKRGTAIGNSSVIVRKDILNKIGGISEDKKIVASEDFNTWLRIAEITDQFKYIKNRLGYYLVHDKSAQNRDLSIPHKHAVIEFMSLYNDKQKLEREVKLKYMSGNYNVSSKNYIKAINNFVFVLKNGDINFKIRSIFKILKILLR